MTSGREHALAAASLVGGIALSAVIVGGGVTLAGDVVAKVPVATQSAWIGDALFNLVIFAPLAIIAMIAARLCGVRALAMGAQPGAMLALGAGLGVGGVLAAAGYAALAGAITPGAFADAGGLLLAGLAVVTVQAGAEEIAFRGWMQPVIARAWGPAAAIGLTALSFAGLHVMGGARAPVTLLNLALGGVLFGLLAWRGQGVAGALGAHIVWNATEQLVLGLDPNPGAGSFGTIWDLDLTGAALWGGSEEGLNAGIGMTFALVAILAALLMLWVPRRKDAPVAVTAPAT